LVDDSPVAAAEAIGFNLRRVDRPESLPRILTELLK
jgi:hypothetical protein